jgi:hypothetical protein
VGAERRHRRGARVFSLRAATEFVASLLDTIATDAGQRVFAADYHAEDGVAPVELITRGAVSPPGNQLGAQFNQATDRLDEIVVNLVGSVFEGSVEKGDCGAAALTVHRSACFWAPSPPANRK